MSDIVEGDDNMIVLVVADEDSSKEDPLRNVQIDKVFSVNDKDPVQKPYPVTFKIEPLDDSTIHDSENNAIKEEPNMESYEYEVEFLEELPLENEPGDQYDKDHGAANHDSDQDYQVEEEQDDDEDDQNESSDFECQNTSRKKRTPKGKAPPRNTRKIMTRKRKTCDEKLQNVPILNIHKRVKLTETVSYVQQLRDENPDLNDDEEQLIKHLATLMRDTVPPPPPDNYYKVILTENGMKKYKCSYCGDQAATTEAAAARHYQYKHGEYYLNCYACGYAHKDTPTLYKHERRCRAPDAEIVLRARGLYLGRKGRSRPFFVNTKFITKNTFVKQKGEDGSRRHYCSQCDASYTHRENLKAHENTHKGLRPHRCPHCPNSYASYMQYKRHLNLHGDYQYICDHCGKKFKLRPALVSHLETHQPRKHSCLYCDRRFAGRMDCEHHMNKVHLKQPAAHGCPVCPKRYAKMSHVKEHMSKKHGLLMMTAKMFCRAMPKLTDEEIERTRKLFKIASNSTVSKPNVVMRQPEHILPDILESDQQQQLTVPMITKIVKIIKKKDAKSDGVHHSEEIYYHDSEDAGHEPEDVNHDPKDVGQDPEDVSHDPEDESRDPEDLGHDPEDVRHEIEETYYEQEDYPIEYLEEIEELETKPKKEKPQPKKKNPRRLKIVKIDEEYEKEDMYNIEYKRKRKTKNPTTETKQIDEEMYKIVRDIKSTLINRKKVITKAEKKKPNFYEIKRDFLDQLKNEIEAPESKMKIPRNVSERQSEKVVPGTEIPEDLVPWTKTTKNVSSPIKKAGNENGSDLKINKDVSEKNKVVLDFLEYVKTGVVPKRVPILRRGRETKK